MKVVDHLTHVKEGQEQGKDFLRRLALVTSIRPETFVFGKTRTLMGPAPL